MSFVNLLESDVWSTADIASRVRLEIRARVSQEAELKAARLARKAIRTAEDQAYIDNVDAVVDAALAEGAKAAEDMALLAQVLSVESGTLDLDSTGEDVRALYLLRQARVTPLDPGVQAEPEPV